MTKRDEDFMLLALAEAEKAGEEGEVPVGAVCVSGNKVLGRGHNQPVKHNDPTAHAEIMALRQAGVKRKNYRLVDCDLYVTVEPCAMCLGALVLARIRRLIYGCADPKAGAVRSRLRFPLERTNHQPEIQGGLLADQCSRILKDFFKAKRQKVKRAGNS